MRTFLVLSIFFCARLLSAQTQMPPAPPVGEDQASIAFRQMELVSRAAHDALAEQARHTNEKRAQEYARLQFQQKANKFVALWGDFATKLNEKQTFDTKLAKKLAKAFHELEASDGWPLRSIEPAPESASRETETK